MPRPALPIFHLPHTRPRLPVARLVMGTITMHDPSILRLPRILINHLGHGHVHNAGAVRPPQ